MIISVKNDTLLDIKYYSDFILGCHTCDYGSSYVNEITLKFKNCGNIVFNVSSGYEPILSERDLIKWGCSMNFEEMEVYDIINSFYKNLLDIVTNSTKMLDNPTLTITMNNKEFVIEDLFKSGMENLPSYEEFSS